MVVLKYIQLIAIGLIFIGSVGSLFSQEYNPKVDYNYNFEQTNATIIPVSIDKGIIKLPVKANEFHTAMLEVSINSGFSTGQQPHAIIDNGEVKQTQYFEYGGKGIRYINISHFLNAGNSELQLSFIKCRLSNLQARLILYKNKSLCEESVVVLAPHPDDAEIAAYGLYASNSDAFIANITVGDSGKKMYDELYTDDSTHYIKKANIRMWNSITVPILAGVDKENIVNLGYFDASLKHLFNNRKELAQSSYTGLRDINLYRSKNISGFLNGVPGSSTWQSLVNDMKHIVQQRKPTVIVTPYPAIDVHADHQLTTRAMIQALRELEYYNVELWLYSNHYVYSEFFPFGKAHSLIALPPTVNENTIYFNRLYSHPLNQIMQGDKTLALEAMNALRPDTEWHTNKGSKKLYKKTKHENRRNTENDYYYRRAVRSNELFFVVSMKDLKNDSIYQQVMGKPNY